MISLKAPIVLFVYNRLDHTKKTVEALKSNILADQTPLIIYSDAPKHISNVESVMKVREYLHTISGFHSVKIVEREYNWGIDRSMISALGDVFKTYERAIIVEDDIVTSPYFLSFMNEALDYYETDPRVTSITGFSFPQRIFDLPKKYNQDVFFARRSCSSGWAIWKTRFDSIEWICPDFDDFIKNKDMVRDFSSYGKDMIDLIEEQSTKFDPAWDIRLSYYQFMNNSYTVYPIKSFVQNIGFDNSGLNSETTNKFNNDLSISLCKWTFIPFMIPSSSIINAYASIYNLSFKGKVRQFVNLLLRKFGWKMIKLRSSK